MWQIFLISNFGINFRPFKAGNFQVFSLGCRFFSPSSPSPDRRCWSVA